MYWNIDLDYPARQADTISQGIITAADKMNRTIDGLNWSGAARWAADDRSNREQTQMRTLASAFEDLATTCRNGHAAMAPMVESLKTTVRSLEGNSFTVHEDWEVTETLTNAEPDEARVNEALNQTVALQRLAAELGWADDACAQGIRDALADIATLAPESAGLNPTTAAQDLADFRNGKATPEELERLQLATNLTEQQRADLLAGRPVDLPQEQYDYLREMMRSMDGMSVEQISEIGSGLPADQGKTVAAGVSNALQLMSNPQITTAGVTVAGESPQLVDKGGMAQVPTPIRSLLTENPLKKNQDVDSGHGQKSDAGNDVPRAGDFRSLVELLDAGDPQLAQGTDIDRGLLKQAAEIAGGATTVGNTDVPSDTPNKLASSLLEQASGDNQAVHDLLTGTHMESTVPPGEHYNPTAHIDGLLNHDWTGEEEGLTKLITTIDGNSTSGNPHLNQQAGESASALANYIGTHRNELLHIPESATTTLSLGAANPEVTGALGDLLSNYIPNMVGVREGLLESHGFPPFRPEEAQEKLKSIFAVMDSDRQTAIEFNSAAYATISQLNQQFGLTGGKDYALAQWAGAIDLGAQSGVQSELESRIKDQTEQQKEKVALFDSVRDGGAFALKQIPVVGDLAEVGLKVSSPQVKHWLLGSVPELEPGVDISDQGSASSRYYNVLQGMSVAPDHPDYRNDPDIGRFFDPGTGVLRSYEEISQMNGLTPSTNLPEFSGAMLRFLPGLAQYEISWDNGRDLREGQPR